MAGEAAPLLPDLWIVGTGRVGLALALLLQQRGAVGRLTLGGRRATPPEHPLFRAAAPTLRYLALPAAPDPRPSAVVVAVPDGAVRETARRLAEVALAPHTPVLHTSGALGADALAPLAEAGCSVGSCHPLAAISDPVSGAERLRGAWFALEGEGRARALGEWLVGTAGGRILPVDAGSKPLYHAAAVIASNYVVTLLDCAERLLAAAGVRREEGRAALAQLAAGAVRDVERGGPSAALTGPIARGDVATVRLHLGRLSGDSRALYSVLARETLALARRRGLDPAAATELEDLFRELS